MIRKWSIVTGLSILVLILGSWLVFTFAKEPRNTVVTKNEIVKKPKPELSVSHLPSDISAGISYESKQAVMLCKDVKFSQQYSDLQGIFSFRGSPYRDIASVGTLEHRPDSFRVSWTYRTEISGDSMFGDQINWFGGNGWTGQPCLVEWPKPYLSRFDSLFPAFKKQESFREVVLGSLNGKIYFLDLQSGKKSRPPFDTHNPIKGTVSLIPGTTSYLFAGQGIPYTNEFGFRVFDLNTHRKVFFQSGRDGYAYKGWGAFDSSPLMDFANNQLWCPGENGLIYQLNLNQGKDQFKANRFRYKIKGTTRGGIESSMAAWQNLGYVTDNGGTLLCLDLETLQPVWFLKTGDDSDASPVVEERDGVPYVYTACEIDLQGDTGKAWIRKVDGIKGNVVWEKPYACYSIRGKRPVNGGVLATPVVGKQKASHLMVVSLARHKTLHGGTLVALNKETGQEVYRYVMKSYSWSSPIDLYDKEGNMYLFTADAEGTVYLLDGLTGTLIFSKDLGNTFEGSPAAMGNRVVLGARGTNVYCFEIL